MLYFSNRETNQNCTMRFLPCSSVLNEKIIALKKIFEHEYSKYISCNSKCSGWRQNVVLESDGLCFLIGDGFS